MERVFHFYFPHCVMGSFPDFLGQVAQVYLTNPSDSSKGLVDGLPYRHYAQYTYGMQLSLTSYQASDINYRSVAESIRRNVEKRPERLKAFSLDTANAFRVFTISENSSNYR